MKGANALTKRNDTFKVTFDLTGFRGGPPLMAQVTGIDGRQWLAPVVSQGGCLALQQLRGGDGRNTPPPPNTALIPIWEATCNLWDSGGDDRLVVMTAGFADRPRRPHQPGAQPTSDEVLAVSAYWIHERRDKRPSRRGRTAKGNPTASLLLALQTRHALTNTERGLVKKAKAAGVWSDGKVTDKGAAILESVRAVAAEIEGVLRDAGDRIPEDELRRRTRSTSVEALFQAALLDLRSSGAAIRDEDECPSCGEPLVMYRSS